MTDSSKLIFVIDDDRSVFAYLQRKIGGEFDLLTTSQPECALQLAQRYHPSLVLCDIDMPGADGGDLSTRFAQCESTKGIPFAFLTSLIEPAEVDDAYIFGGSRPIIAKKTGAQEMVRLIRSMIH